MRHFKTAWKHIRRSPYQALSSILVMTLVFFLAAVFVITASSFQKVLYFFETRPQVSVYFDDNVTLPQVETIKNKLLQTGKVLSTKYISKDEALAIYKEQIKDDPLLLEMVSASILPTSLEISTKDLMSLKEIAQTLKSEPGVQEVVFQEDVVNSLLKWTNGLRIFGAGLILFLALTSIFMILVVIGMKISLRKEEIEILRLIGASFWYISAPFILEGIFYGVVGALFSWVISYGLLIYITPLASQFLTGINLFPISPLFMLMVLGGLMGGGFLFGIIGSLLAIKRYLK